MVTTLLVVLLLLNTCVIGLGIYLSSYLKEKAKNLATREEFKELEKQTAALTRTTAQIEADIKGSLWDRQKRWELKREVLFEMARRIAAVFDALKNLDNILQTELKNPTVKSPQWTQTKITENAKWFRAKAALDESRLFVGLTCRKNVVDVVDGFSHITTTLTTNINNGDGEIFRKSVNQIFDLQDALSIAIRQELGVHTSQSVD